MYVRLMEPEEDYLETVSILRDRKDRVRNVDISRELGVNRVSISASVQNLKRSRLVEVSARHEIMLTLSGEALEKQVYERHQLFFQVLCDLGLDTIPLWRMRAGWNMQSVRKALLY